MTKKPGNFFHQLLKRIVRELREMSTLRFAVLFMIVAESLSLVMVLSIDFLWDGRFNKEMEFAGVVTPIIVGLFIVVFVAAMFDEMREEMSRCKLKEIELRESEMEFHTLAEAMPQIVWITRADGWNIYINEQWMNYTGLTHEESLGHGWNKPFHPDDQQQIWDAWQLAVATGGIYSIESRVRRADGIYRWWLVRGVPVKDANGDILKWFGTCTDIHDLKMAELAISNTNAELRESERRFSDLLGNVELISMMLDREARITYCNEYLLRLTGWKREEIIGKNWFDIFAPPELSYLKASFFDTLLANLPEARHHENEIITRSGDRLLIHWDNSVLRSAEGDVIGTASIGEDITARRQALEEIEFKNTILQTQQEASPDAILVVDENGGILSFNQQFIELWHLTPQMVSARLDAPVLQSVVEQVENPEAFVARIQYLYEHREEKSTEEIRFKDGRIIDRYSAPAGGANGKYYGRVWYFRNVTERRRLELDREQYFKFFVLSINPMCIADPFGCFMQVNPAFVKLTGYSESELIAEPFLDFVLPEDRQRTEDEMKLQVEKRPTLYFDNRYLCKDGSVIDLSWTAYYDKHDGITYATAIDITQYKQAQQALQVSRENLYRLLNSMAEGAYGVDTNGDCTFVNRAFLQILGYQSEAEVMGKHIHELIHHSHADGSPYPATECRAYCAFRLDRAINVFDEVFWRKDGVAVPVEYWSHPIASGGVAIGAIVTFVDITERMNAIAEMREKEVLLSESQRIAHIGSWRFELSGELTWSDETYRIYGISPGTFTPNIESLIHLIHPADRLAMQEWISSCIAGNKPDALEFRVCPPDGTERVISGFGELQYDALNRPKNLIGIVHDITERKHAEGALRKSEERYRQIVETSQEGIWIIDANNVTTFANKRIATLLGYTVEEMLGMSLFDFMDEAGKAISAANVERRHQGINEQHDFKLQRKDGTDMWVIMETSPMVNEDGEYMGALAMITDITDRFRTQSQLTEQLDELRRWHEVTSGREGRILELKHEVNEMLGQAGQPMRYPSAESQDQMKE